MSSFTLKDESIAHCATARSAEDIHVRCDVIKSATGEYGNPFLETIAAATFSFSTHGTL